MLLDRLLSEFWKLTSFFEIIELRHSCERFKDKETIRIHFMILAPGQVLLMIFGLRRYLELQTRGWRM